MKIYAFDRNKLPVWQRATRKNIDYGKFVGWLPKDNSNNGIIAIAPLLINHIEIRDSFLRYNPGIGEPNVAGLIKHYKIVGWHSLFLDLSTPGDKMSPIREAIAQLK
jgi:hypothetical protein